MRTVIDGSGRNTTATVASWLAAGNQLSLANLYLIGESEDPGAIWITDWQSPLKWSWMGTFYPATIPSPGKVVSEIGFKVATFNLEWTPTTFNFTQDISTTTPYHKVN